MARRTDTCIYYHRNSSLLDDDLQEVLHSQTLVGTDRCSEWHHGSSTSLFEVLAEGRVCLAIWQYHETELYQFLGSLQRLDRVWKKIARVWVDFKQDAPDIPIRNLYGAFNNYRGKADTLEELAKENGRQDIYLRIELEEAYPDAESFAADCHTLMEIIRQQAVQPYEVTFVGNRNGQNWYLDLQEIVQQEWTEQQMAEQVEENRRYDSDLDHAESDALDEENEAETEPEEAIF